jgi:hypothetical protein
MPSARDFRVKTVEKMAFAPADQTVIAGFLRNLCEGRPSSTEEWDAIWKFLEDGSVIARRTDFRYRTHEFFPELERWLRRNEGFLQLTDEQQVNATGSHYHWWLKARPYPPAICFSYMMAKASRKKQQGIEDAREDQATFGKPSSPEEELEKKEEAERLAKVYAPRKPKPGPRPKDRV